MAASRRISPRTLRYGERRSRSGQRESEPSLFLAEGRRSTGEAARFQELVLLAAGVLGIDRQDGGSHHRHCALDSRGQPAIIVSEMDADDAFSLVLPRISHSHLHRNHLQLSHWSRNNLAANHVYPGRVSARALKCRSKLYAAPGVIGRVRMKYMNDSSSRGVYGYRGLWPV